ncbi:MAG: glycoside hydrolase family 53 protein, partial [bacterium]
MPQDPLKIFKDHGINYIRLKLWHTPNENYNNLEKILYMAKRIKDRELKFLLNFHYSDTWADPGRQRKPAAWVGLPFEALRDSVYAYTKNVMRALYDQQTLPEMVQIGNEITPGMLWNDGRVGGAFDTPQQWSNLGELIKAGVRGVRESCEAGDSVRLMIHLDRGGDNAACRWYFNNLLSQGVEFDVIGLSYYPWWHGTLNQVRANLNDLAVRYGKDLIVAETAYPWTLQWFDNIGNIVGSANQLHAGYPATVDGQAAFLAELIKIVRNVRDQKGKGVFYWAPEYISVQPIGSPWENNALFDFTGNVLSSMQVFLEEPPNLAPIHVTIRLNTSTLMDTLQPHHFTQIRGEVSGVSSNVLPDEKRVTWESDSELILKNTGGDYWEITIALFPGDTLSYKFWSGFNRTRGTFQRLGWEGPITPAGNLSGNRRVFVAGESDTVINAQYY